MRPILIALSIFTLLATGGLSRHGWTQTSLPSCATDGDKDRDGVADTEDSDETDSCDATFIGVEDCTTGSGDGIPDCE